MSNESKQTKLDCPLVRKNGNIFNIVGIAAKTLKGNDMLTEASEIMEKVLGGGSYEEALGIIGEYVNITSEKTLRGYKAMNFLYIYVV